MNGYPAWDPIYHNTYTKEIERYGVCEYHGNYSAQLRLVALHNSAIAMVVGGVARRSVEGPIYICQMCQNRLGGRFRTIYIHTKERTMKISDYLENPNQIEMTRVFVEFKNKFSVIEDVFIVPPEHLNEHYRSSLNIAIQLSSFSTLSYTAWSLRESKSVMYLWEESKTRSKFWSAKVTRLLIALGRISHDVDNLDIWIRSYGRLFHIDHFVRVPQSERLLKIIPGGLIRLEK